MKQAVRYTVLAVNIKTGGRMGFQVVATSHEQAIRAARAKAPGYHKFQVTQSKYH